MLFVKKIDIDIARCSPLHLILIISQLHISLECSASCSLCSRPN